MLSEFRWRRRSNSTTEGISTTSAILSPTLSMATTCTQLIRKIPAKTNRFTSIEAVPSPTASLCSRVLNPRGSICAVIGSSHDGDPSANKLEQERLPRRPLLNSRGLRQGDRLPRPVGGSAALRGTRSGGDGDSFQEIAAVGHAIEKS